MDCGKEQRVKRMNRAALATAGMLLAIPQTRPAVNVRQLAVVGHAYPVEVNLAANVLSMALFFLIVFFFFFGIQEGEKNMSKKKKKRNGPSAPN